MEYNFFDILAAGAAQALAAVLTFVKMPGAGSGAPYYLHSDEGPDDMPSHAKSIIVGPSLTIPIKNRRLNVGTWQGIYLCEFRDYGGPRKIVATIIGD